MRKVLCEQIEVYNYSPYATEAFGHDNDLALVADFRQSPDCPEDPDSVDGHREDLPECVTYEETDTWLLTMTVSGKPTAKSAKVHAGAKHAGKGKHRK